MMANLRAGLIGLGMMGRHHARVLASLDGVDLVGIADPTGGVPAPPRTGSRSSALARGAARPGHRLRDGRHPHPVPPRHGAGPGRGRGPRPDREAADHRHGVGARDRGGVRRRRAGRRGRATSSGTTRRCSRPGRRIANGDLGEIYQITTRRQGPFPGRIADVGVILDLATHDIDLTAWVAQQPFTSVAARTAHRSGRPHEDLVAITGQLADGTVTNHLVNWLSPMKERVTVITGEKGALVADTLTADLTFFENGVVPTEWSDVARFRGVTEGDVTRFAFAKPEPLRVEHENFRDAVLGKDADIVTLQQAAATVAVANAAAESAATGQVVVIATSTRWRA